MKKAIVSIVVGDTYHRIYNHIAPINRMWMERWGWDSIIIDSIPDDFKKAHSNDKSPGWVYFMYKFVIPSLFKEYDLIAFVDSDCVINPNASCLSEYIDNIPNGGFAGVQTVSFEERKLFPNWSQYYYDGLNKCGYDWTPRYPERHVSAGLLLYRPRDVWKRWIELLNIDNNLNEENRLNVYEVQEDRCFFLPKHWHVVWFYERVRRGWSKGAYGNKLSKKMNQVLLDFTEQKKIHDVFENSSIIHFGFEHQKTMLVNPDIVLRN